MSRTGAAIQVHENTGVKYHTGVKASSELNVQLIVGEIVVMNVEHTNLLLTRNNSKLRCISDSLAMS